MRKVRLLNISRDEFIKYLNTPESGTAVQIKHGFAQHWLSIPVRCAEFSSTRSRSREQV